MRKEAKAPLRFISNTTGKKKGYIVILSILNIVIGLNSVIYALLLRDLVNGAVDKNRHDFWTAVIAFAVLSVIQILLLAVKRHLDELSRVSLENCFKGRLFSVLFKKDYGRVAAVHSAQWMNMLTSDTQVVASGVMNIIPGLSGMVIKLIGAIILILAMEPRFAYLILPGGALLVFFSWLFRKKMKKLHKNVQEKDGEMRVLFQEGLAGMPVVRSYGMEGELQQMAGKRMDSYKKARMNRNRFSNLANVGFGLGMKGAYVLGIAYCGYGILTGTMSYGNLMAIMQLVAQIQGPMANVSGYVPQFYSMIASAERLMQAEEMEERETDDALSSAEALDFYENSFEGVGFSHVDFAYSKDDKTILKDCSIYIPKGRCIAFTGASGCGKSTVLKLLLGLYNPVDGTIFVDSKDGRSKDILVYQGLFAYVPQGNYLMSGTIREVVTFADRASGSDDEKLCRALEIACADEFVYSLENGPETVLGERGLGLSEGQMQRLSIARAIFSDRPILLLDECTSALDAGTEQKLLKNLHEMTNKTVVIITHRPAALEICDNVIHFSSDDKNTDD